MTHKFNLGDEVKDKVTGLQGIATARLEYLNGCIQYGVQRPLDKDGKHRDTLYIDHKQLELVKAGAVKVDQEDTGGATTRQPR